MRVWKHNRCSPIIFLFILCIAVFAISLPAYAKEIPFSQRADIVFVIDCSGSTKQTDPYGYSKDALRLGIDLAPSHSRIGMIAVSDRVISEFPLTDAGAADGRASAKSYISSLYTDGNTNFLAGIDRAVEMLSDSTAAGKRVIFLGDFQEGGYNQYDSEAETAEAIGALSSRAKNLGIAVDMLLFGSAPEGSVTAPGYEAMPDITGGRLYQLENPSQLPAFIEEIYFYTYEYFQTAYTLRGESAQTLQIPMPTNQVKRARIYVSASNPVQSFGATYAGTALDGETTRSYAMIDLEEPSADGISITLTPGETGTALVYLLLDYDIKLAVTIDSEFEIPEGEKEYIQTTTFHTEIVDCETGAPIVSQPFSNHFDYSLTVCNPDGAVVESYESNDDTSAVLTLREDSDFGMYEIKAELTAGDFVFSPEAVRMEVEDIRPIVEPLNWPLYIATVVSCLLILIALIIAFRHRKKEAEFQGAVEMSSDYRFHGKLSVYAVMLEGGEREMRPFDFGLHRVKEKRVTVREILDSVGAKDTYAGAEDILFLVGPEESLTVRNNSHTAALKIMGRSYGYRSKVQIFYDQKLYIVFEKDENELEISYRRIKEEASEPIRFNISAHSR